MIQTVIREGTLDADGALQALELAQGIPLSLFSLEGGLEKVSATLNMATPVLQTFLMNVSISLSGLCYLNWGKSNAWHPLVEALLFSIKDATKSRLPESVVYALVEKNTGTTGHASHADILFATPTIAMVLLLRWLRTDLVQVESHFNEIILNRQSDTPS